MLTAIRRLHRVAVDRIADMRWLRVRSGANAVWAHYERHARAWAASAERHASARTSARTNAAERPARARVRAQAVRQARTTTRPDPLAGCDRPDGRSDGGRRQAGQMTEPGLTGGTEIPLLVERAYAVARKAGFPLTRQEAGPGRPSACLPGVGRFLAMLAAGCHGGVIAELGTGAGIGAAWICGAMPADCTLVTAELDDALAAAAARLLAGDARVRVLAGDASAVLPPYAPFELIFADSGVREPAAFGALTGMLGPGGRIVMDDLTPRLALPGDSPLHQSDVKRDLRRR